MRRLITVDPMKCTGCGICELICSALKDNAFNRRMARIRVVNIEPVIDAAIACRFCEEPVCVRACPRGALRQSEENGVILVDENKCNACGWCIEACDFGAITLHSEKRVVAVCDLCNGEPKCVEWCPRDALELVTLETLAQRARISSVKKLFQEAISHPTP